MVKKVRTAIVTMVTSVETAAAPTENAVAGLSTLVICEVNLVEPSERYFCRWRRKTSRPSGPWPFLASLTSEGTCLPKCTAAVTNGSVNRYTRPASTRAPRKTTERGAAMRKPWRRRKRVAGVMSSVKKKAMIDVDHDVAQHPQPEDQRRVDVEQQNDHGDRDDDRPEGMPRRCAPRNLERHVSWGFGAIAKPGICEVASRGSSKSGGPRASMRSDARGGADGPTGHAVTSEWPRASGLVTTIDESPADVDLKA